MIYTISNSQECVVIAKIKSCIIYLHKISSMEHPWCTEDNSTDVLTLLMSLLKQPNFDF